MPRDRNRSPWPAMYVEAVSNLIKYQRRLHNSLARCLDLYKRQNYKGILLELPEMEETAQQIRFISNEISSGRPVKPGVKPVWNRNAGKIASEAFFIGDYLELIPGYAKPNRWLNVVECLKLATQGNEEIKRLIDEVPMPKPKRSPARDDDEQIKQELKNGPFGDYFEDLEF